MFDKNPVFFTLKRNNPFRYFANGVQVSRWMFAQGIVLCARSGGKHVGEFRVEAIKPEPLALDCEQVDLYRHRHWRRRNRMEVRACIKGTEAFLRELP